MNEDQYIKWRKKDKCMDCKTPITKGYLRCRSCNYKFLSKENHWNWKDGVTQDMKKYKKKYYEKTQSKQKERRKELYQLRRRQVIEHYGGSPPKCKCCGESIYEFLTIDHIKNGGNNHARESGGGAMGISHWIIKNNFPPNLFQILCFNCNLAKSINGDCPHKKYS
jgi:DNA-directed RNA polymerase subunit RPC12/RpoP